jgi:hypothetical protein
MATIQLEVLVTGVEKVKNVIIQTCFTITPFAQEIKQNALHNFVF